MNIKLKILLFLFGCKLSQLNAALKSYEKTKKQKPNLAFSISQEKNGERLHIYKKDKTSQTEIANVGIKKDASSEPRGNLYDLSLKDKSDHNKDDFITLLMDIASTKAKKRLHLKTITIFPASVGLTRQLTSEKFQERFDMTLCIGKEIKRKEALLIYRKASFL